MSKKAVVQNAKIFKKHHPVQFRNPINPSRAELFLRKFTRWPDKPSSHNTRFPLSPPRYVMSGINSVKCGGLYLPLHNFNKAGRYHMRCDKSRQEIGECNESVKFKFSRVSAIQNGGKKPQNDFFYLRNFCSKIEIVQRLYNSLTSAFLVRSLSSTSSQVIYVLLLTTSLLSK